MNRHPAPPRLSERGVSAIRVNPEEHVMIAHDTAIPDQRGAERAVRRGCDGQTKGSRFDKSYDLA